MPKHPKDVGAFYVGKTQLDGIKASLNAISIEGDWLEFGVYKGDSLRYIAKRAGLKIVYGFDSFKGLPEDWVGTGYTKGGFSMTKEEFEKIQWPPNSHIYIGWFEDTIPRFLKDGPRPIAYLHIDSDLYSSAVTIFKGLKDCIMKGTVIEFDEYCGYNDWERGEALAFEEFLTENGRHAEFLFYGDMQAAAIMVD